MPPPALSIDEPLEEMERMAPGLSPRKKGTAPSPAEMVLENHCFEATVEKLPSLEGKAIAITGTTSGTGYWCAMTAIQKGASCVFLLNRQSDRSAFTDSEMKAAATSATAVLSVDCDLNSFASCRAAAEKVLVTSKDFGGLDVLACNAGVMAMPDERTADGYDIQMQCNGLSHFLLTALLMPALESASKARGEARIVQHSSGARFFPLGKHPTTHYMAACEANTLGGNGGAFAVANFAAPQNTRYNHTKLACAQYALALHNILQAKGSKVKSLVCEPGIAATSLPANGWQTAPGTSLPGFAFKMMMPMFKRMFQSGPDGTCPLLMACFATEATSGDFWTPRDQAPGMRYLGLGPYITGPPIRTIINGIAAMPGMEKRTLDKEAQAALMAAAEEATGEKL